MSDLTDSEVNVPSIAQNSKRKTRRKTKKSDEDDLPLVLRQRHIVAALMAQSGPLKPFPECFRVYRKEAGEELGDLQIVEVNRSTFVCQKTSLAAVARTIANRLEGQKGYCLTDSQIDATAKLWLKLVPISEPPVPYLFKGESGIFKDEKIKLCFRRVPWDPDSAVDCPTWRKIFPRTMINYRCFMAYIGSMFFDDSYNQQFLVIKGEGGDGKGSLIRFLEKVMGNNSVRVITRTPTDDNKHGGSYFAGGKRIVAFADLRRPSFLHSDLVMAASGGDTMYIDPKGSEGYCIRPNIKMLAMVNCPLSIPKQRSFRRRYIPAEMPFKDSLDMKLNKEMEEQLWGEGPGFLGEAIATYREMCPDNNEMIKVPQDVWDYFDGNKVTAKDEVFFEKINEYYDIQPQDTPKEQQVFVTNSTLYHDFLCVEFGKKRTAHQEVKAWLKRKYGIEAGQLWSPSEGKNLGLVYFRLKMKGPN